jgi:hypothetical protein
MTSPIAHICREGLEDLKGYINILRAWSFAVEARSTISPSNIQINEPTWRLEIQWAIFP